MDHLKITTKPAISFLGIEIKAKFPNRFLTIYLSTITFFTGISHLTYGIEVILSSHIMVQVINTSSDAGHSQSPAITEATQNIPISDKTTRVEGRVKVDGLPANFVFVEFVNSQTQESAGGTWTNSSGQFVLDRIPCDANYELLFQPANHIMAEGTTSIAIGNGDYYALPQAVELLNSIGVPLQVANFAGLVTGTPSNGPLPDGRVIISVSGTHIATAYTGGDRDWKIESVMAPLGVIDVQAMDGYGLFHNTSVPVKITAGQPDYFVEIACPIVWWKPLAVVLVLALPAIQELIRRSFKKKKPTSEANET